MRLLSLVLCGIVMIACSKAPDAPEAPDAPDAPDAPAAPTEEHVSASDVDARVESLGLASEKLAETLLSMPGVAGVADGDCDGEPCIRVMLEYDAPELIAKIPEDYNGFPVQVDVSGIIQAED